MPEPLLPCQQLFLASCADLPAARLYTCEPTKTVAAIHGPGPDEELLLMACEGCKKAPPNSVN